MNAVDRYFEWLLSRIEERNKTHRYSMLLRKMFNTKFRYTIIGDGNRVCDALSMRESYKAIKNTMYDSFIDDKEASVLEVLVALSIRCENDIMQDDEYGDRTGHWFWCMIENMNLMDQDNDMFDEAYVDQIMDIFMDRKYGTDGLGGPFFVEHPLRNMRRTELWYQMQWELAERFRFDI